MIIMTAKRSVIFFFVLLLCVMSQNSYGAERWYNHYKKGATLLKESKYAQAILEFEMATEGVYEDQRKKIQTYGMHFIRYYPHREIGVAAYHLNDFAQAREELELSMGYAPTDRAREYLQRLGAAPTPPRTPESLIKRLSLDERKNLQRILAYKGFYGGTIDGIFGAGSRSAVQQFQAENKLGATGDIDEETLAKLHHVEVPSGWTPESDEPAIAAEAREPTKVIVPPPSRPITIPRPPKLTRVRRVGPRLTVAVIPLADRGSAGELAHLMAEKLVSSLVEYQRFRVIERSQLDKILKEQKFGLSDLVESSTAARLGKLVGVDCLVVGSAWVAGGAVDLTMRLVDTETGEVLATRAGQCRADSPSETRQIAGDFAAYFANMLPLAEGTVVKVDPDETVYLDLGSQVGMRKGMKLVVFHEGEKITHPVSGEVIGSRREKQAELVLTEVMDRLSVARFVEGQEGNVSVRDPVVTK